MALRIPQFRDLDKITANTYRTYVARISDPDRRRYAEQSMGSGAEYDAAVREADQLDATLADPSRRARMVSPFQARYDALTANLKSRRNAIVAGIRNIERLIRRNSDPFAVDRFLGHSRSGDYNLDADITQADLDRLRGHGSEVIGLASGYHTGNRNTYANDIANIARQFQELGPLRNQIDAFDREANAGITNSMSATERSATQARAVAARRKAEELSRATAQRLTQALASYNTDQMRGAVATGVVNSPAVRGRARFAGRAPGVGISIGGMG